MNKRMILGLIILAIATVILVLNSTGPGRSIRVDLIITQINALKSLVFLAFIATGVVIGILFK